MCAEQYCLPSNYSEIVFPKDDVSSGPLEVTLQFISFEALAVNDVDFTVTMRGYIDVTWTDPRIIGPTSDGELKTPVDLNFLKHLWKPDLEILHLKQIRVYSFLKQLAGNHILKK